MPGPKPKPTALKLLAGESRPSRVPQNEPHPRPILPDMPRYMSTLAEIRWNELLPELDYMGTLTAVDADVLGGYCMAWAEVVTLTADIEEHGRTYTVGTNGAQAARPEVGMLNKARDEMRKLGSELGIGAASRSRISVEKPNEGATPLAGILEEKARAKGRAQR